MDEFTQAAGVSPEAAAGDIEAIIAKGLAAAKPAYEAAHDFGAMDISKKSSFSQVAGALMPVAVTGQLVALFNDLADQLGVSLGNPAQREKGRFGIVNCQHLQNASDISLNAAFARVPL